ncbi:MAG: tRNA epoxyqueuosine(34) reductase QueG [Gemmatimonadota bacterium]|nr:tRNA epoxyqueuosine(34) reductase QueG [Gemmatimonadota bacterium]
MGKFTEDDKRRLTARIKRKARGMGFSPVGVAPAGPPAHWGFYLDWLAKGYAGQMAYLGRRLDRRSHPGRVLPGARTVLCVGMNYDQEDGAPPAGERTTGRISRYARGDDYHDLMNARLKKLLEWIQTLEPGAKGRVYVDTGPVLERDFAARAGIGWFGKHTNLIHKRKGSWFFLGEILLTLPLVHDRPVADHCGTCTLCMDACPTDAIPQPYVLDSNRCISYLTIELKGAIPGPFREKMGDWIYGCDICQEVCPWNRKQARPTAEPALTAREGLEAPELAGLLAMDQTAFSRRFRGSPIKRAKRRGLLRNAAVALGNRGTTADIPALTAALSDAEPLVRGHAAWALGRIGGPDARRALSEAGGSETDEAVREEIGMALDEIDMEDGSGGRPERRREATETSNEDAYSGVPHATSRY